MTIGWLLLVLVLVIASSHGQTTIDNDVCDNVEDDCNSIVPSTWGASAEVQGHYPQKQF